MNQLVGTMTSHVIDDFVTDLLFSRAGAGPAASRGAFKRLPGTRKPAQPPGFSGKGFVSKLRGTDLGCFIIQRRLCLRLRCQDICSGVMLTVALRHVHGCKQPPFDAVARLLRPGQMPNSHMTTSLCLLQKVEDAVGTLELELASLLEAVEAPDWRPLLDKLGERSVDVILEEARRGAVSSREEGTMTA